MNKISLWCIQNIKKKSILSSLKQPGNLVSGLHCSVKKQEDTNGAFFSCCVYRGHELKPWFNHCTTCVHNSGLVKFELPRLSRPGITWRWMLCNDTHVITIACRHRVLHQYYTSQHGKVQLRNGLLSLCACAHSAMHDMIKTHTTRAHEITSGTHDLHHMNEMHHRRQKQCSTIIHTIIGIIWLNLSGLEPCTNFEHVCTCLNRFGISLTQHTWYLS